MPSCCKKEKGHKANQPIPSNSRKKKRNKARLPLPSCLEQVGILAAVRTRTRTPPHKSSHQGYLPDRLQQPTATTQSSQPAHIASIRHLSASLPPGETVTVEYLDTANGNCRTYLELSMIGVLSRPNKILLLTSLPLTTIVLSLDRGVSATGDNKHMQDCCQQFPDPHMSHSLGNIGSENKHMGPDIKHGQDWCHHSHNPTRIDEQEFPHMSNSFNNGGSDFQEAINNTSMDIIFFNSIKLPSNRHKGYRSKENITSLMLVDLLLQTSVV